MSVKALLALFYYVTLLLYLFFNYILKLSNILSIFNVFFFTSSNMLTTECNTTLTSVKSKQNAFIAEGYFLLLTTCFDRKY